MRALAAGIPAAVVAIGLADTSWALAFVCSVLAAGVAGEVYDVMRRPG